MSKIALTPNASGNGVFTITAPNSGTNRAIALPDAAGTIALLAAASNTAITATPAELNILDGVTSTAAELNILDGVTSTAAELNILDGVTSTAAELNILDGVTSTAAEINLIDGGTARGTTAVADGDGFLTNDGGTMRMTKVETLATYMGTKITGGSMVFIASSGAISDGTASVVFTAFDASKFDHYVFMLQHVKPATDAQSLAAQTSTNGGTNFASTNGDYHYAGGLNDAIGLFVADTLGNDTHEYGASGKFELFAPHATAFTYGRSSVVGMTTNGGIINNGIYAGLSGNRNEAADVDAIRFLFVSGNIEAGEIVMYGIANA